MPFCAYTWTRTLGACSSPLQFLNWNLISSLSFDTLCNYLMTNYKVGTNRKHFSWCPLPWLFISFALDYLPSSRAPRLSCGRMPSCVDAFWQRLKLGKHLPFSVPYLIKTDERVMSSKWLFFFSPFRSNSTTLMLSHLADVLIWSSLQKHANSRRQFNKVHSVKGFVIYTSSIGLMGRSQL